MPVERTTPAKSGKNESRYGDGGDRNEANFSYVRPLSSSLDGADNPRVNTGETIRLPDATAHREQGAPMEKVD